MNEPLPLSPRQRDVLREILRGHDTKIAARNLGLCPSTVKNHAHEIYARLGVGSREEVFVKLTRPTEEAMRLIGTQ